MATAGNIVLTGKGKRGLRSNGKAAVFNSRGGCPECCFPCPYCDRKVPTYEMVLADLTFLCIGQFAAWWKIVEGGELNGTQEILWDSYNESSGVCYWILDQTVDINRYDVTDTTCAGAVVSTGPMTCRIQLSYDGTTWTLTITANFDQGETLFYGETTGKCASATLTFENDNIGTMATGGTAVVAIP